MPSSVKDIPTLQRQEYSELLEEAAREPEVAGWVSVILTLVSFGLFGVGAAIVVLPWSFWWTVPLAGGVLAMAMLLLSLVVHESSHRTLFDGRRVNDVVGFAAGFLTVTPFLSYRRGHVAHHRYLGSSEGKDPTASPQKEFRENRALDAILRTGLLPVFYWAGVYGPYLLYDLFPTATDRRPAHVLQWMANMLAIAALHFAIAWWLGPVPYLIAFAIGFVGSAMLYENLFTLNQHIGLLAVPQDKPKYSYREQLNFSRSVRIPLAALFFYFNLHKEHHLAPGLNWRYLPVLHRLLRRRHPEIYEFTDEDLAIARRRKMRAHELLTPRVGDRSS